MKQYRQDAHVLSLVAWAIVCVALAAVLFWHGHRLVNRALMWSEYASALVLLVFGPAAFVVYFIRSRLVWVRVDPEKGILVGEKYAIPWASIRHIERRPPKLRKKTGPAEVEKLGIGDVGSGCGDVGSLGAAGEAVILIVAVVVLLIALVFVFWLVVAVIIPLIVVPVLEVFAPLGDRIKIVGQNRTLVLRDLRDADGFMRDIGGRVPVNPK